MTLPKHQREIESTSREKVKEGDSKKRTDKPSKGKGEEVNRSISVSSTKEKTHGVNEGNETSSKSTKASLRQAKLSFRSAEMKVSSKAESNSRKSKEKENQGLPAETVNKAPLEENNGTEAEENLLKTPSTYSLCTRLVEAADYQQEEVSVRLELAGGVTVEEHLKKGS